MSSSPKIHPIQKIVPYLSLLEKIFLVGLAVGVVLIYFKVGAIIVVSVALAMLAIVYYLSSYAPLEIRGTDEGPSGFVDLLSKSIIPKVLWFSISISLFGLFIITLQLHHNCHLKMLVTGGISILLGLVVTLYAALTGTKHLNVVVPVLCRAIPVGLLDAYFLYAN